MYAIFYQNNWIKATPSPGFLAALPLPGDYWTGVI